MIKSSTCKEYKNIERNKIIDVRNLLRLKKLKKETNDDATIGTKKKFWTKKRKAEKLKILGIFSSKKSFFLINQ